MHIHVDLAPSHIIAQLLHNCLSHCRLYCIQWTYSMVIILFTRSSATIVQDLIIHVQGSIIVTAWWDKSNTMIDAEMFYEVDDSYCLSLCIFVCVMKLEHCLVIQYPLQSAYDEWKYILFQIIKHSCVSLLNNFMIYLWVIRCNINHVFYNSV
jgi:hypothetical protein